MSEYSSVLKKLLDNSPTTTMLELLACTAPGQVNLMTV